MKHLTLLIKPASSRCDLRCTYCFYRDLASARALPDGGIMSTAVLSQLLREVFRAVSEGGSVTFFFQGGEPTLAGLPFFRRFLALEQELAPRGVTRHHAIQTNGMTLTGEWADFFRAHDFLVGLSLDGTQALHDRFRRRCDGGETWERVLASLRLLQERGVEVSLLTVVTAQLAKKPQQVYRSLTSLGVRSLQFIPCLDPLDAPRGGEVYSLTAAQYGSFLCRLFDCWYRGWQEGAYVSIRGFEDYLSHLLRRPPSSCAAAGSCGHYLVVESDGSLYPCDFYAIDRWRIGNILECGIDEALHSPLAQQFCAEGLCRPAPCRDCRYEPLCRGGCRRDWTAEGLHPFCSSYRQLFSYALPRLLEMADHLRRG